MFYYIQSEQPNEWIEPTDNELFVLERCIQQQKNIKYEETNHTLDNLLSIKCNYHKCVWKEGEEPDVFCSFQDYETGINRKAIWSVTQLEELPLHQGAQKVI